MPSPVPSFPCAGFPRAAPSAVTRTACDFVGRFNGHSPTLRAGYGAPGGPASYDKFSLALNGTDWGLPGPVCRDALQHGISTDGAHSINNAPAPVYIPANASAKAWGHRPRTLVPASPLHELVIAVVLPCAKKQMIGIDASGIVAFVANVHVGGDLTAIGYDPASPVSGHHAHSIKGEPTVATASIIRRRPRGSIAAANPFPASSRKINGVFRGESLNCRAAFHSRNITPKRPLVK